MISGSGEIGAKCVYMYTLAYTGYSLSRELVVSIRLALIACYKSRWNVLKLYVHYISHDIRWECNVLVSTTHRYQRIIAKSIDTLLELLHLFLISTTCLKKQGQPGRSGKTVIHQSAWGWIKCCQLQPLHLWGVHYQEPFPQVPG